MRLKSFVLTILSLIIIVPVWAKTSNIKYGKNLIYVGNVENNIPKGEGRLVFKMPSNEQYMVCSINGYFDGLKITKANIVSPNIPDIICYDEIQVYCVGEIGKVLSAYIPFDNVNINMLGIDRQIKPVNFTIGLFQEDKKSNWKFYAKVNGSYNNTFVAQYNDYSIPWELLTIGFDKSNIISVSSKFSIDLLHHSADEIGLPIYKLDNGSTYSNNKFMFEDGNSAVLIKDNYGDLKSWEGLKKFNNGETVSYDGKKFSITRTDGSKYFGTIKENIFTPLYNSPNLSITYNKGIETVGEKTVIWVNGETFEKRHERLKSFLSEELLTQVENNEITEEVATKKQKEQDSIALHEKRIATIGEVLTQRVESQEISEDEAVVLHQRLLSSIKDTALIKRVEIGEVSEEYAIEKEEEYKKNLIYWSKELKTRYGGKVVLLTGVAENGTKKDEESEIVRDFFSISTKYFHGKGILGLADNGVAKFEFAVEPILESVMQLDPATRSRIVAGSARVRDQFTGKWSIKGEKLYINGSETSIRFLKDKKTALYEGVMNCRLKVKEVSQESFVPDEYKK